MEKKTNNYRLMAQKIMTYVYGEIIGSIMGFTATWIELVEQRQSGGMGYMQKDLSHEWDLKIHNKVETDI